MNRNKHRLAEARKMISVGKISGAVGTFATLSPQVEEKACHKLGLTPAPISHQGCSATATRANSTDTGDYCQFNGKFSTESGVTKTTVREVEEPFSAAQTREFGMPQRNPELCERGLRIGQTDPGYSVHRWKTSLCGMSAISAIFANASCLPDAAWLELFDARIYLGDERLNVYPKRMKQNMEITRGLLFSPAEFICTDR